MKTREPLTIDVDPDSELARALESSSADSVYLKSNGVRFRVVRTDDDLWADYDPDAVLVALREVAGSLAPEEGERMKELIYRARAAGTRPLERP